jgi:hypothetical protein
MGSFWEEKGHGLRTSGSNCSTQKSETIEWILQKQTNSISMRRNNYAWMLARSGTIDLRATYML